MTLFSTRYRFSTYIFTLLACAALTACSTTGQEEDYDFVYQPPHAYESPENLIDADDLLEETAQPQYDYRNYERDFPEYDEDDLLPGYLSEEENDPAGKNLEYTETNPALDPNEEQYQHNYRPDEDDDVIEPHYSYGLE